MKGAGLLGSAGNIPSPQLMDDGDEHTKPDIITYEIREMAQTAIDRFHEVDYKDFRLQVICPEAGVNSPLNHRMKQYRLQRHRSVEVKKKSLSDFPVRTVVPSNMIGALIGKEAEGKTIRQE